MVQLDRIIVPAPVPVLVPFHLLPPSQNRLLSSQALPSQLANSLSLKLTKRGGR